MLFLSLVLLVAAGQKLADPARHASAAARLVGTPERTGAVLARMAGGLELIAAVALFLPDTRRWAAAAAVLLWGLYTGLLLRRRGETLDCGCSLGARKAPIGLYAIARAILLTSLALVVALAPNSVFSGLSALASAGLFSLYIAADQLAAIPAPAWRNSR